jgi:hypothetical protein
VEIPVLLEPTPTGFRATTGGPLHLAAEGETEADTLARVNQLLAEWTRAGRGKIYGMELPETDLRTSIAHLADDPFMTEWAKATADVRREREAEEMRTEATQGAA